jgi:Lysine methyltransferase
MSAREVCIVTSELLPSLIQESSENSNYISEDRMKFPS